MVLPESNDIELLPPVRTVFPVPVESKLDLSTWRPGLHEQPLQIIVIELERIREKRPGILSLQEISRKNTRHAIDLPFSKIRVNAVVHDHFPEKSRIVQSPCRF